jgi:tRNA threonylcarbamoyladenosine modification (KEOPS) complex Cgi121 subunit
VFSGRVEATEYAFGVVSLPENWEFPKARCHVQLVDASKVFGEKHVVHCIFLTVRAFEKKQSIAGTPELELLVRLAGTKQISEAIKQMRPSDKAVLIAFGENAKQCFREAIKRLGAEELGENLEKPGEKDAMEKAVLAGL